MPAVVADRLLEELEAGLVQPAQDALAGRIVSGLAHAVDDPTAGARPSGTAWKSERSASPGRTGRPAPIS